MRRFGPERNTEGDEGQAVVAKAIVARTVVAKRSPNTFGEDDLGPSSPREARVAQAGRRASPARRCRQRRGVQRAPLSPRPEARYQARSGPLFLKRWNKQLANRQQRNLLLRLVVVDTLAS